jgi:hypothetical protein
MTTESTTDFKPVSLIRSINEIISKELANAFIKGHIIFDGSMAANEVVDWLHKVLRLSFSKKKSESL